MADKAQLAGEVAKLEMETKQWERELNNAKGTATGGAVGALIGIIFLFVWWPLGALLLVAGVLAWVTGASKRSTATGALMKAEKRLAELKGQLAAM